MPCSAAADLVVPCGCHREFCEFRSQDSCIDASNNIFANIARNYQNRYAKSPGNTHMSLTRLTFLWHDTSSVDSAIRQKKRGCIYCSGFFLCNGTIAWSLERVFYSQFICVMSLSASAGNLDRVHLMHDDCKLFVSCETFPSLDSSRTSRTQGKRKQHRYKGKIGAKLKNGPGYTHVRESGSKSILRFFCKVKK